MNTSNSDLSSRASVSPETNKEASRPGTNEAGQPEANEAGQPGANEAGQPGANEAGQPGANEAGQPGANEAGQPGANEASQSIIDESGQSTIGISIEHCNRKPMKVRNVDLEPKPSVMGPVPKIPREISHVVIGAKGGIGKSFVASIIAQWYRFNGLPYLAFDMDSYTPTISQHALLNTKAVNILEKGTGKVNDKAIENTLEELFELTDTAAIIDVGSSTLNAISTMMEGMHAIEQLNGKSADAQVIYHCPLVADTSLEQCLEYVQQLSEDYTIDELKIVVWLMEHTTPLVLTVDGKAHGFEDLPFYRNNPERFSGILRVPYESNSVGALAIKDMIQRRHLMLEEVANSKVMSFRRSKLRWHAENYFTQLNSLFRSMYPEVSA